MDENNRDYNQELPTGDVPENNQESNIYDSDDRGVPPQMQEEIVKEKVAQEETPVEPCYHERVKASTKKKKSKPWRKFIAACVIVSFVGGGTMGVSLGVTQRFIDSQYGNQTTAVTDNVSQSSAVKQVISKVGGSKSTVEIIKEVKPSVVSISTEQEAMKSFGGFGRVPYSLPGAGSGIVFYQDDVKIGIATNNHVVENANNITVTFSDEKSVKASVAGTDSTADLAVLTILKTDLDAAGITNIRTATFGDSDDMEEGEGVVAIGNALGEGISVTDGIVSATGKTINLDGRALQVIQTNAAINQGNSGGALVNESAQVIGINTAKVIEDLGEGMGYAIPSNTVVPIIEKLLIEGTRPKPYIGIRGSDITREIAEIYKLKLPVGVLVVEVIPGSSAEDGGLVPGDIITGLNDKSIISMNQLVEVLASRAIGDTVTLSIIRDAETPMEIQVVIKDANLEDIS